ncbi:hypothetical protein PYCCODRAFT_1434904 [Trametes coccinea BRFM310]|uniref:Uncharacterized protein n=1 Tax=Trametes coccinea (strain BRFM310) TaxID=1353009 RepID=A0A1Y2IPI5_TRAC3|nr:hypothetical protein PYCCODRAFT_1434904 [Trametes coccinea BRFM310]
MSDAEVQGDSTLRQRAHNVNSGKRGRTEKAIKKQGNANADCTGMNKVPTQTDKEMDTIRQKLAFLCHDLRTFSANEDAEMRLNTSVHTHFLGPPYLTESQAELVQSCLLFKLRLPNHIGAQRPSQASELSSATDTDGEKTLRVFLDERTAALVAARKAKSENDFVLCTSHDLAPLLQEACGFSKQHFETRAFKDAYKRWIKEVKKVSKKP